MDTEADLYSDVVHVQCEWEVDAGAADPAAAEDPPEAVSLPA